MNNLMYVYYKYDTEGKFIAYNDDLVCALTEFMDLYLIRSSRYGGYKTYLYNDLDMFSTNDNLRIAFRVPGATRGAIILKQLNKKQFKILDFQFNYDVCFGEFACYNPKLEKDIQDYIGIILDFSKVILNNNKEVENNE